MVSSSALLCTPLRKSCEVVVCENEESCDFFQNTDGKLRKKWRASLEKDYSEPFTMQTTSTDQVHCTQLCSLHTRIVVQSCSYAPTSERMPNINYAPKYFQPPNYANNYAGIIRRYAVPIQCTEKGMHIIVTTVDLPFL